MLKLKKLVALITIVTLLVVACSFIVSATSTSSTSYKLTGSSTSKTLRINQPNTWELTARGSFNKGGATSPDSITTDVEDSSRVNFCTLYSSWNNATKTKTTYNFEPSVVTGILWVETTSTLHRVRVTSNSTHTNIIGTATITGSK
ncbi:MAG: hypothetical protein FWD44_06975 [Oscillospiraceae bacterium]|nr:hypothetical protein [Oscillospiraceae bacterium]